MEWRQSWDRGIAPFILNLGSGWFQVSFALPPRQQSLVLIEEETALASELYRRKVTGSLKHLTRKCTNDFLHTQLTRKQTDQTHMKLDAAGLR
jgi:hypothetical protein